MTGLDSHFYKGSAGRRPGRLQLIILEDIRHGKRNHRQNVAQVADCSDLLVVAGFGLIIARLARLQIVDGEFFAAGGGQSAAGRRHHQRPARHHLRLQYERAGQKRHRLAGGACSGLFEIG